MGNEESKNSNIDQTKPFTGQAIRLDGKKIDIAKV